MFAHGYSRTLPRVNVNTTDTTLPVCLSRVRSDVKFEGYFYSNLQSLCCCCYGSDSKVTKLVDWLFVTEFLQLMMASS